MVSWPSPPDVRGAPRLIIVGPRFRCCWITPLSPVVTKTVLVRSDAPFLMRLLVVERADPIAHRPALGRGPWLHSLHPDCRAPSFIGVAVDFFIVRMRV